jgi:hypothetical protein
MMKSLNSSRVRAPDPLATGNRRTQPAIMMGTGQSPPRKACTRTSAGQPGATNSPLPHPPPLPNNRDSNNCWDIRQLTRIATWNVLTLRKTGYQVALVKEMARLGIDIAGLTEVRIPDCGRHDVNDTLMLFSGGMDHTQGVALLLRDRAKLSMKSWLPISSRLLIARLTHKHGHLSIIVAYAPTEVSPADTKDTFYDQLHATLDTIPPHDHLVLLGDFNAVSGTSRLGYETVIGNSGSGIPNDNSHRLITMCAAHGLTIIGSWFQRRNIHRHTWISNDGRTSKEIDHIITRARDRTAFTSCKVYRGAECAANTDHRLLVSKMRIKLNYGNGNRTRPNKFDTDRLAHNPAIAQRFSIAVSNRFDALAHSEHDVEEEWSKFSNTLRDSAEEIIGTKRRVRKPWLSEETHRIIQEKAAARHKGDKRKRNRLKHLFDKKAREDKEKFYNNIADEAELGLARNDLKAAFRAIKILGRSPGVHSAGVPIKDVTGAPCKTEEETIARWAEHYEKALNHPAPPIAQTTTTSIDQASAPLLAPSINGDAPTMDEVRSAILKMKNGRAPGPDHITAELLKYAIDPVSKALQRLFEKVWRSGSVPTEWKEGIIISLYKGKGPRCNCNSYRPITLLSVPGKVFAHVLLARLQPLLLNQRRPQQSGFTQSRSTLDAILALRLLSEVHREFQRPLHVAYIDLKAAFDSVDRKSLWKALRGIGVPEILTSLIGDLHNGTTAKIRIGQRLSAPFPTTSGVRQGCVLAPALFCRAMDVIMEQVSLTVGVNVGRTHFTDTNYADDVVLFVNNENEYPTALLSMETEASKLGLHVSWSKTKIQNIGTGSPDTSLTINNEKVEAVTEFSYLGSLQTNGADSTADCQRHIGMAANTMKTLSRVWNQRNLSLKTKFRIYSTCVLPVLLYGSECWTLSQNGWNKLQAFNMRCQRRIMRVRWDDFVSNLTIEQRSGITDLVKTVRRRRLGLFGHVARLHPNAPARQILQTSCQNKDGMRPAADWKRPRGRPRNTWIRQIVLDTNNTSALSILATACDRDSWRSVVTAANPD